MRPSSKQNCTNVLVVGPGEGRRAPEGFAINFIELLRAGRRATIRYIDFIELIGVLK